ncbi:endochitinase-like [Armigeres subalbatus]|uniref:endochitinase-like n=1 Tax=Armigeres subalbatus TaxID=124917 RepID=UPI002ED4652F
MLAGDNVLLFTLLFSAVVVRAVDNGQSRRLVCHYTTWSQGRSGGASYRVENIPGNLCTHVVYNFIGIDEDTYKLVPLEREIDIVQNGFGRFTDLKKTHPELKTTIAVGGWKHGGAKFSKMAASRERRKIFVQSVVNFLEEYGFDGLEIAWLYPGNPERGGNSNDKDNIIYLAEELKRAFQSRGRGWEVTVQVPLDKTRLNVGYDIEDLCEAVHFVHLIGYDLRGWWNNFADVHSPMGDRSHDIGNFRGINVRDGVQHMLAHRCQPGKMILGVPLFGRTYNLANPQQNSIGSKTTGSGPKGIYTQDDGYLGYCEICVKFRPRSSGAPSLWPKLWDDIGQCPYTYRGREWIGYEDERSLQVKIDFVKEKQLAGIYAFSLDLDDYLGDCASEPYPLTRKLYEYIKETKECGNIDGFFHRDEC